MSNEDQHYPSPPEPPSIKRTLQFHRIQKIGIPILLLLPVLALFGVFGETFQSAHASNTQLTVDVEYPSRSRYKMINPVTVSVENTSSQTLSVVQIHFDRDYIDNFSNVSFTPEITKVTDEVYIVEITDLQPQETRVVSARIQAERYWLHEGNVTAVSGTGQSVSLSLDTIVFP